MKKVKKYEMISLSILAFISMVSCDKKDDDMVVDPDLTDPTQPVSVAPNNAEFGGTIGFWDFNANGDNSEPNESGDWTIDGINYGESTLVFDENVSELQAINSRVLLFDPSGSSQEGLHQRRYFSGALKFKVEKDPNTFFSTQLLSFGTNPRFLDLEILNGKIQMATQNSNILKPTDIEVPEKVWNVLYFRHEGFLPQSNTFYLQLNDGDEVAIDLDDFNMDEYANENDTNLGFSSRDSIFKGTVDWVIMARGRMTPGNAQHIVGDFKN